MKFLLIMYICSAIEGNACKIVYTVQSEFKDMYDCTVYGYDYSTDLIKNFDRKFVNEYEVYTKFSCIKKTKTTI